MTWGLDLTRRQDTSITKQFRSQPLLPLHYLASVYCSWSSNDLSDLHEISPLPSIRIHLNLCLPLADYQVLFNCFLWIVTFPPGRSGRGSQNSGSRLLVLQVHKAPSSGYKVSKNCSEGDFPTGKRLTAACKSCRELQEYSFHASTSLLNFGWCSCFYVIHVPVNNSSKLLDSLR